MKAGSKERRKMLLMRWDEEMRMVIYCIRNSSNIAARKNYNLFSSSLRACRHGVNSIKDATFTIHHIVGWLYTRN